MFIQVASDMFDDTIAFNKPLFCSVLLYQVSSLTYNQ